MTEIKKGNWWTRKTTFQKVTFIIGAVIFTLALLVFLLIMDARRWLGQEIGDALFGPGVPNGWVTLWNAITSSALTWLLIIIILFVAFMIIFLSNFITHLFDNKSRKAKTISSLIRSLIKYIVIIVAVCFILILLGVDVIGIIAGVGVITLIIGLGCQSLIQDVISGVFIVFDDYFAVGDTVIIDGFRGVITEVGLKTTKLLDIGGNIKSISNNSINTVVNLSRMKSIAKVILSVSYNEEVERVEGLILRQIEEIKTKVPNISEGPYYKGIDAITSSSIDFLVICYCNEVDRFQVTRDMNREFYMCFKKNGIQIPFTQVTINPQDEKEREKPSPEDVALALKEQKILRGIKDENEEATKKKKTNKFVKKMKESYKKAAEEME